MILHSSSDEKKYPEILPFLPGELIVSMDGIFVLFVLAIVTNL